MKVFSNFDLKSIAAFVILAIVLNTTVPAFAYMAGELGEEGVLNDKILVCTPYGYKYIKKNKSDEDVEREMHCPLCNLLSGNDYDIAPDADVSKAVYFYSKKFSYERVEHNPLNEDTLLNLDVRGPPCIS